ncbi:hypothetical protein FWK35_00035144 [Aphis craccivora]|uniref:Uncharacterized protein n=1 Tax=Aphis craccivora TaxID=307492 RepID=A0A6G0VRT0_APHCR|nr:hypothetical protein FWK35_00035144 [Aphis craccivora]
MFMGGIQQSGKTALSAVSAMHIFVYLFCLVFTVVYVQVKTLVYFTGTKYLRGRRTRMCCLRLTHVWHSKFSFTRFKSMIYDHFKIQLGGALDY